jgi:hypothetical protein
MAYEGISEYASKKLLDHLVGKAAYTMPTDVYVALYDGDPLVAGTELSDPPDTDYARVAMADTDWVAAAFASPVTTSESATDVDFGTAGSAWGTVDYFAVFDALTGGNMLFSAPLTATRNIQLNDPVKFPAGSLLVRLTQDTS